MHSIFPSLSSIGQQLITSPVLFTGTEIWAGFAVTGPLLTKTVGTATRALGDLGGRWGLSPLFTRLSSTPKTPIPWLSRRASLKVLGATFFYSSFMFGWAGLPFTNPISSSQSHSSFGERVTSGGLVMGFGSYLKEHYGHETLIQSSTLGNYTQADPWIWLSDYAANVFFFSPLIAAALGAPVKAFMRSGALLYWAPILGAARMTSVWAPEGKDMHVAIGRGALFLLTNSALALSANRIISARATNLLQVGIALGLSALTYYATRPESSLHKI